MIQIPIDRVAHSVINLIEQIQPLAFLFCPKQPRPFSHNLAALQTILSTKHKCHFADDIHTGAQNSKLDKTNALKQLLDTRG